MSDNEVQEHPPRLAVVDTDTDTPDMPDEFKEVAAFPKKDRLRIVEAVDRLRDDPKKGKILSADWKGFRRLRAGRYRVIYAYEGSDLLVSVIRVGDRRDVYR